VSGRALDGAYCYALLFAHWFVRQKLDYVSSVQLRHSVRVLKVATTSKSTHKTSAKSRSKMKISHAGDGSIQMTGPQTENACFPNWVRVLITKAALVELWRNRVGGIRCRPSANKICGRPPSYIRYTTMRNFIFHF